MRNGTSGAEAIETRVSRDPELVERMRGDVEGTRSELSFQRSDDVWARRVIVIALSMVVVVATAGGFGLSLMNRAVPQLLMALGSMALGALISLLATSHAVTMRPRGGRRMENGA